MSSSVVVLFRVSPDDNNNKQVQKEILQFYNTKHGGTF